MTSAALSTPSPYRAGDFPLYLAARFLANVAMLVLSVEA